MSLWQRFKRALRSIFGGWVSEMEDPALILEQNIRDMRDKIPKMNENIAMLKANAKLLEKEKQKLEAEQSKLIANVKAAIGQNREDIAGEYGVGRLFCDHSNSELLFLSWPEIFKHALQPDRNAHAAEVVGVVEIPRQGGCADILRLAGGDEILDSPLVVLDLKDHCRRRTLFSERSARSLNRQAKGRWCNITREIGKSVCVFRISHPRMAAY